MEKHQKFQDTASGVLKKKKYSKPVLTILGKVSELTAGGSGNAAEKVEGGNPELSKRRS